MKKFILLALLLAASNAFADAKDPEAVVDPKTREELATRAGVDLNACHGVRPEVRDQRMDELARKAEERRQQRGTEGQR